MLKIKNFINNEWSDCQSQKTMPCLNPATAEAYGEIPDSDAIDIVMAIQSSQKAFVKWSQRTKKERSDLLNKIADSIEVRLEEFAICESKDTGKPLWLTKQLDIPRAIENFRYFASLIKHEQTAFSDMDGQAINYVLRQPFGVCGLISPWNLPLYLLTWKIAPALAAGNTVVCKPSEETPASAFLLTQVLAEVLPPGVCNIIFGRGETAGSALVSHPGVAMISFTGGTQTGLKIQELAAPQFKKLSLELGGKNANIILKDADLEKAAKMTVRSSFLNSGQICLCAERVLIQEDVYKEFMDLFINEVKALKLGSPEDPDTFMGPLISEAHLKKVIAAIDQAKKEEGKVIFGGKQPKLDAPYDKGYFLEPTIIEDLTNCSELWQEEIFGPVVTTMTFKYPADAVKWANTSSYGLSASLWTKDLKRAHKIAAQINVGTVWVNTWMKRDLGMPFGGMKQSGVGREGGNLSLDTYSETKTICISLE